MKSAGQEEALLEPALDDDPPIAVSTGPARDKSDWPMAGGVHQPLRCAPAIASAVIAGKRKLCGAFRPTQIRVARRETPFARPGDPEVAAVMIRSGFVFRGCTLPDGRRAILDLLLPGDVAGISQFLFAWPAGRFCAVRHVGYQALGAGALRELMADRDVAACALAIASEVRCRANRLTASLGRLDAEARICVLLLDVYDRLRQRALISRPAYNLPLTQEQIADHLGLTPVHVNRVLARLRDKGIVAIERHTVVIFDLDRLRAAARDLPQLLALPEPDEPAAIEAAG